ncbi:MAG: AMP-binding protein [Burkholderiaceae bacterium]
MAGTRYATRSLPLIRHTHGDQLLAWRAGAPIDAARFLADARALADRLPAGSGPLLNGCQDRYHFSVGLAAALLAGRQSVVPHNHLPQTLGELAERFEGLHALIDSGPPPQRIPYRRYPDDYADLGTTPRRGTFEVPQIDGGQIAAWLFTSGSTGAALAYPRRWEQVVRSSVAEARRLRLDGDDIALLATVPAQHSYGFESAVGLPLLGGGVIVAERPFYPADLLAELARLPGRRALITSPVHLRALLASELPPLRIDLILSATAPLPIELARAAEERFESRVVEIYGSTESGQVASRRTVEGPRWYPLEDVVFAVDDGMATARGGHVGDATRLSDSITLHGDGSFELHGRVGDLIHIGGKRSSIVFLEGQLCGIDGVDDAALLYREGTDGAATRLTGFVVAPRLSQPQLLAAVRGRLEAAFVPRPLYRVDRLPRDGNGKLPRQRLLELADACAAQRERPADT